MYDARLGPWIGVVVSLERISLYVVFQASSKGPALAVSQFPSGSFQMAHAEMLVTPDAFTAAICLSTADSQSLILTHL
ncbi:hypothetical protein QFZ66_007478 [Streptomyces sp. B4I13]|uniref:hypothetical protein n=1 Tax=Streptomyces sp. B4I13 TaxID=3042271 RepID=UPI00278A4E7E|nr:hypothetical protein [Streptomyces sp. B4I13]MDQ0963600.1 hypothetical protein [Streptomyces sp. B4I13]